MLNVTNALGDYVPFMVVLRPIPAGLAIQAIPSLYSAIATANSNIDFSGSCAPTKILISAWSNGKDC